MDNDETKKLDLSDINSELEKNNDYKNIDDTINSYDASFLRTIDEFEEIDKENNLSVLEPNHDEPEKIQSERKGYIRKVTPTKRTNTVKRKSSKPVDGEEMQSSRFYVITLVSAVCVCIAVFLIVFSIAISGNSNNGDNKESEGVDLVKDQENEEKIEDEASTDIVISTGLIENIAKSGAIQIYDFAENQSKNLKYTKTTKLTDQYGKALVIDEIKVGDIVDYGFKNDATALETLSISNGAFRVTKQTGAKNDVDNQTLTFNNKLYKYNDRTIVNYERGTYKPSEITEFDLVDISGYEDTIYCIDVIKGHGSVYFVKNPDIVNCVVEIDTSYTYKMDELTTITLSEGPHRVVVKGDNIDPYNIDILVEPNKSTEVSLLLVQSKQGLLIPNITPADYQMRIDGEYIDTSQPILLDYGPHTVYVSKDGYMPYQTSVNIKGQETRLTIKLEEKVLLGKLNITTDPEGAKVYIDNAFVGNSPVNQPVEYGNHTITIKLDGYVDISYPVTVNSSSSPIFFPLQKSETAVTQ